MITSATVISENLSAMPDGDFGIVRHPDSRPMPPPESKPLQDYVLRVMRENGMTFSDVERMARRRGGKLGKSSIQAIAQGETKNPGIFTLVELSWGLSRPIEEILGVALGSSIAESVGFRKSDFANLFDLYQELPAGDQRAMKRFMQMMEREMRRVLMQLAETDQLQLQK